MRLQQGDRVSIVGGGPAGSFAALHLLREAAKEGIRVEVTIYEARDWSAPGAGGNCKGCAGILSDNTLRNLTGLGLCVPESVVQSVLRAYTVHLPGQTVTIEQPFPDRRILSVFRGAGPRHGLGPKPASFDGYLLSQALAAGAHRATERVRRVEWDAGPVLQTNHGPQRADFLILATGVNSRHPLDPAFGYLPPDSEVMAEDEIMRPADWPDDTVAGFFGRPDGLLFGALVPKGQYLNVSLLWRHAPTLAISRFYAAQQDVIGHYFTGTPTGLCGCTPRIAIRPSASFYGDRWVAVGDAVVSHLYKDGINSAFETAGAAVQAAVHFGISGEDFRRHYAPTCARIAADNRYGALLYGACARLLKSPLISAAFSARIVKEAGLAVDRRVHSRLLWGMLTGDESYADLFRLVLNPRGLLGLAGETLRAAATTSTLKAFRSTGAHGEGEDRRGAGARSGQGTRGSRQP